MTAQGIFSALKEPFNKNIINKKCPCDFIGIVFYVLNQFWSKIYDLYFDSRGRKNQDGDNCHFCQPKRKEFCRPDWLEKAFLRSTLSTMMVQTIDRLIWWLWDYCCSMPPKDPRAWPSVGGSSIPSYDLLITKIQNRPITKIRPALVSNQNTWYCHTRLLTFSQTFLSEENYDTIKIIMKIKILSGMNVTPPHKTAFTAL